MRNIKSFAVITSLCLVLFVISGNVLAQEAAAPAIFSYGFPGVNGENTLNSPGGVAVDQSGNVYVADTQNHRVQKFSPLGGSAILTIGTGLAGASSNQFNTPTSIAVDSSGNIYVVDTNNNRVQKFGPNGGNAIQTFGSGIVNFPQGIALDQSGNVYVADANNHRVRKFSPTGTVILNFGDGTNGSTNAQLSFPRGVAVDQSGNVFVVDGGTNHRVQRFAAVGGSANLTLGTTGVSGSGLSELNSPFGVAVDSAGNIYVADTNNNRVRKFAPAGGNAILTFGNGSQGNDTNELGLPNGVAIDSSGNVYVADSLNDRIQKFTSTAGDAIQTFGGPASGSIPGKLNTPWGVDLDSAGNVYVADTNNHRIQKFAAGTNNVLLTIGTGTAGSSNNQLDMPRNVLVDSVGNIYAIDSNNHRVQKFDASGNFLLTFGTTGSPGSGNTQLINPSDATLDAAGNLYVVDLNNHRVQRFPPTGGAANMTYGTGVQGTGLDQMSMPTSVTLDADGNVYVADTDNDRVLKFAPTGGAAIQTFGTGFPGSGANQLSNPTGVLVTDQGFVYVSDRSNHRVQKFNSTGGNAILTFAGTQGIGRNRLDNPGDIALDAYGSLYVADQDNHRVQVFDPVIPEIASISSTTPNGTYYQGQQVNITVTFTEPVTLAGGNLQVNLETGTTDAVVSIPPFSNSLTASGTYTVASGHQASPLTVAFVELGAGASLADAAGNLTVLTLPAPGQNLHDSSTIVINGVPPTTPPVAANDTYRTIRNGSFTVPSNLGVLKNDTDADGDVLSAAIQSAPQNVTNFVLNSNGSFSFVTTSGFVGNVTFTYVASDGKAQSAPATVTVNVDVPQSGAAPSVGGNLATDDVEPIFEWAAPPELANAVGATYEITIVNNSTGQTVFSGSYDADQLCVRQVCQLVVEDGLAGDGVLDAALMNGSYTYFIQLIINNVQQEIVEGDSFEVEAPEPVLLDFEVDTSTGRPIVRFPDNQHSLWYLVTILKEGEGNATEHYYSMWHKRDDSLCDVTCLIMPDINPQNGEYQLWVQTWGPAGFIEGGDIGGWAGPINFTLLFDRPDVVSGLTVADTGSGRPTFQWNASEGATWYEILAANNNDFSEIHREWVNSRDANCAYSMTCTYVPSFILTENTTYQMWMQVWGPGGFATGGTLPEDVPGWIQGESFVVDSNIPAAPTLGAPIDVVIDPKRLTYTWEHQPQVSWYQVQVEQTDNLPPGENPVDYSDWFAVEKLQCRDDGICEVVPPLGLVDGNYRWRVRGYTPAMGDTVSDTLWSEWQVFSVERQ